MSMQLSRVGAGGTAVSISTVSLLSIRYLFAAILLLLALSVGFAANAAVPSGLLKPTPGFHYLDENDRAAVVLIHGWNPENSGDMFAESEWPALIDALHDRLRDKTDWRLQLFDWHEDASTGPKFPTVLPQEAFINGNNAAISGKDNGHLLFEQIRTRAPNLRRLVLVAHSAGSWVAKTAAERLLDYLPFLVVNVVLLDPFIPGHGDSAFVTDLSTQAMTELAKHQSQDRIFRLENYFANDATDIDMFSSTESGGNATSQPFRWNSFSLPYVFGFSTESIRRHVEGTPISIPFGPVPYANGHSAPIAYYRETVIGSWATSQTGAAQYQGFALSLVEADDPNGANLLPQIVLPAVYERTGQIGQPVSISIFANNGVSYQWYKDEQPCLSGSRCYSATSTLTIPAVTSGDQGDYVLRVTNAHGHTFSSAVKLTTTTASAPTITVAPNTLDAMPLPQTQSITISGTGFTSGSRLTLSDGTNPPFVDRIPTLINSQLRYDIAVGPVAATWTVKVVTNGVESEPYPFYVRAPATVPSVPGSPSATDGASSSQVGIGWAAVAGAESYVVFRCTSTSTSSCASVGTTEAHSYGDTGGASGNTYYYRIKACNGFGCSGYSAYDAGYRGGNGVPPAPTQPDASDGVYPSGVLVYWSAVAGADSYQVWRATSLTGTKTRLVTDFQYTTYADVQVVKDRPYYYWIKACNYTGACSAYSVPDTGYVGQVALGSLSVPINPDPPNGDSAVSIRAGNLVWENGGGATKYDVYFGTDSIPDSSELLGTTAATQRSIPDLAYGTTYYWRVDARANGQTVQGPVWQFTTRVQSAGEPPNRAINPSPASYTENLPLSGNILNWANGGGATSYDVYFGSNFQPGVEQFVGTTATTSWPLPTLEYGNTYYWKVKAKNSAGIAHGDVWRFNTEPSAPKPAIWPFPTDGQTNVQPGGFAVSWNDTGRASNYDVYFGTDPTPDASEFVANTVQAKWQPPNLQPNTTYYWQVVTRNTAGATYGPIWSFTTWASSPGILEVSAGGFSSVGPVGGPFRALSKTYTVKNVGEQPLDFSVANTHSWLQLSPSSGTLQPGEQVVISASIGSDANFLPVGYHLDTIVFQNTTNQKGSNQRAVSLAVGVPLQSWDIARLEGGIGSILAVKSDGSLHGWGSNRYSELGLGSPAPVSVPAPVQIGMRTDWAEVSVDGLAHSLALTKDGRLFAWGRNDVGQLGTGDFNQRNVPTQIGTDSDWVQIATGSSHSLALKADGRLFSFGLNLGGELGLGDKLNKNTPTQVGTSNDWASVSSSSFQSFAITRDGRLFTWGDSASSDRKDLTVPTQVGVFSDWQSVAGGQGHQLALRRNGTLYAWGANSNGQLGLGNITQQNAPVQVGVDSDWIAIEVGGAHSLGLKRDGRLFGWGGNSSRQLGLGDKLDRFTPTQILQDLNIRRILAADDASYVLLNDGSLFSFGANFEGELGLGFTWIGNSPHVSMPSKVDLDWALNTGVLDPVASTVPGAPAIGLATAGDASASVEFTPPSSDGGDAITGYTVTASPGGLTASGTGSPINVAGLTNGTAYTFTVTATNGVGTSTESPSSNSVTPVVASVWQDTYIRSSRSGGGDFGLDNNELNVGGWSDQYHSYIQFGLSGRPDAVTSVKLRLYVTNQEGGSWTYPDMTLWITGAAWVEGMQWSARPTAATFVRDIPKPVGMGWFEIDITDIYRQWKSGALANYGLQLRPKSTTANMTNFASSESTDVALRPMLVIETGASSITVPSAPTISTATAGDGSATVSFTPPANNGGATITGYTASSTPGSLTSSGCTASPCTISGLSNGTAYTFTVKATNSAGPGPASAASNSVTPIAPSLSVSPASLTFPSQAQSSTSTAQTVTLTSSGGTVSITGITASGDFARSTTCGASLTTGASCTVAITFTPTATGTRSGTLSITSSATGSPHTVTLTGTGSGSTSMPVSLALGWNLLGNSLNQPLSVSTLFGDPNVVSTVWKWESAGSRWLFFTPMMDTTALQTYATGKGYGILSQIAPGEGYWVNAKIAAELTAQTGASFVLTAAHLAPGWNLVATGQDVDPATFNRSLSETPPSPGVVPQNVTSLWAWDNPANGWYFYAPSLEAQGGTALTDYITSKGYRHFTQHNKTLGNGTGFWVRRP